MSYKPVGMKKYKDRYSNRVYSIALITGKTENISVIIPFYLANNFLNISHKDFPCMFSASRTVINCYCGA